MQNDLLYLAVVPNPVTLGFFLFLKEKKKNQVTQSVMIYYYCFRRLIYCYKVALDKTFAFQGFVV